MISLVRPAGVLLLAEGFTEGFRELSDLRQKMGLPPLEPAKINHYSSWAELEPAITEHFDIESRWHLGMYDYLTRGLYPFIVGADNSNHNSNFADKCHHLPTRFNPPHLSPLSRPSGP